LVKPVLGQATRDIRGLSGLGRFRQRVRSSALAKIIQHCLMVFW